VGDVGVVAESTGVGKWAARSLILALMGAGGEENRVMGKALSGTPQTPLLVVPWKAGCYPFAMLSVVPLRYGTAFKKAFSDPLAFSALVKGALGIDFHPDRIEQEHSFRPAVAHINIAYDLFAEDVEQRTVVELQHVRDDESYDRFLYYHCIALAEQIITSDSYRFPRKVYTLVVMTRWPGDPRLQFGRAVGNIDPVTDEGTKLGVYQHQLVFVNARAPSSRLPEGLRSLMALVEDTLDGEVDETKYPDEISQRILRQIEKNKLTAEENATLKEEATWEQARRETAAEAKETGRREGEERGLRTAVETACELLGIELTEARTTYLNSLNTVGLEALRIHLKKIRSWPE
jgi:hypothetical protein